MAGCKSLVDFHFGEFCLNNVKPKNYVSTDDKKNDIYRYELMMPFEKKISGYIMAWLIPNADEVQNKIAALQKFITDNYYICTNEILSGLGEMYVINALETILTKQVLTEYVSPITVEVTELLRFFFCRFLSDYATGGEPDAPFSVSVVLTK